MCQFTRTNWWGEHGMSKNRTGLSAIGQETEIKRDHIFFDIFQFNTKVNQAMYR